MKEDRKSKIRRKQDLSDRYNIRLQAGKTGLVEATSKMDVSEFRVFATALTMILPEDEDFLEYELKISDVIKLFGLPNNGMYYDLFRDAALKILERKFVIVEEKEDGVEYKTTIPINIETSEPVPVDEQNRIRIQFHPKLKPYLLQLKREYLTVDVRNLSELSSQYSVKMYLILKHQLNLGNGSIRYELGRLRQILGIEDHEYPSYGNFKQKVIMKAIKDINTHTDLRVTKFDEVKKVRAVDSLVFYLEQGKALRAEKMAQTKRQVVKSSSGKKLVTNRIEIIEGEVLDYTPVEFVEDAQIDQSIIDDLFAKVQKYKITKTTLKTWFDEVPHEQVSLGINYVLDRIKAGEQIKNVAGYMRNMVYTPSLFEVAQEDKKEQERKRKAKEKKEQERAKEAEIEAQKKITGELYNDYRTDQALLVISILEHQPEKINAIIAKMQSDADNPDVPFIKQIAYDIFAKSTVPARGQEQKLIEVIRETTLSVLMYVIDELSGEYGEQFKAIYDIHQAKADQYGIELQ